MRTGVIILVEQLEQAHPAGQPPRCRARRALAVAEPEALSDQLHHAGSVFLGRHTPEAVGDYIAGPNHMYCPRAAARAFPAGCRC